MEIEDVELRRLADNLGFEWQKLATDLGFKRAKIQQFELEIEHQSVGNIIFNMLVSWRERQPKEINVRQAMKEALEKCERVDLAESIAPEKLLREEQKKTLENEKQAVTKWKKFQQINNRGNQDDKFHVVSSVALHDSGNIAVIDSNNTLDDMLSDKSWSPRVYVFNSDGMCRFVLNSTEPYENPVGKLVNAQGIAVTQEGNYVVADGTKLVKIFDVNGQFQESFSTLTDDDDENTIVRPNCITVNGNNGDVLVGDYMRELVTVHGKNDFNITKVIYVSLKPGHIAVNNCNQILISRWENKKVVAFDYSGDEIYTINPMIAGGFALPHGLACNPDCTTLIAVSEVDDKSRMTKPNKGHVHHYNRSGEFLKCIVKGLYWPLGIALNNDVLAIADKKSVKVFKPEK